MIRRLMNTNFYMIETNNFKWNVVLERTHNSVYGNPRFKATLSIIYDKMCDKNNESGCCIVYTFSGHYQSDVDEARFIVKYHEDKLIENCIL